MYYLNSEESLRDKILLLRLRLRSKISNLSLINICYINNKVAEVEKFSGKKIAGIKIMPRECLPMNHFWFIHEDIISD